MSGLGRHTGFDATELVAAGPAAGPADYLATCAAWRARGPLVQVDHPRFGLLTIVLGHSEVDEVARDDRRFAHAPWAMLQEPLPPPPQGWPLSLVDVDGPRHTMLRGLVAAPFARPALERLRGRLADLAGQLVAEAQRPDRQVDLVAELAMPYALRGILLALGIPGSEAAMVARITTEPLHWDARAKLGYLDALLKRLAAADDPPLAGLLAADTSVGRSQQLMLLLSVLTAGYETAGATFAAGLHELMARPGLLGWPHESASCRDAYLAALAEELVRTATPLTGLVRTATTDTELAGAPVPAARRLWLCFPSADADETVFPAPELVHPQRPRARHLAFGGGRHHCLGAGLARLQLIELLRVLGAGPLPVPVGQPRYYQHHFLRRYIALPARWPAVDQKG